VSESSVPADLDACPRCEAIVRADAALEDGEGGGRSCPECGTPLRRGPLGGWIVAGEGNGG
jgi:hypothetical protein